MSARKPYYAVQQRGWWRQNTFFVKYMIREATALFVLLYCAILITGLYQLNNGNAAWNAWLANLTHPVFIVFHCTALAATLYHTVTWFQLAPKIMVVRIGGWTAPVKLMLAGQWVGFAACSIAVLFLGLWVRG
jgi:fumarate reductase subunit C